MPTPAPDIRVMAMRLCAAIVAVWAVVSWVTPRNVAGKNGVPFACGSPSSPRAGDLPRYICSNSLSDARALAFGLALAAGLMLLVSAAVLPRIREHRPLLGLATAGGMALPLMSTSLIFMLSPVGTYLDDGNPVRCGTPFEPSRDSVSRGLCGDLSDGRRGLLLGVMTSSLVLTAGGYYVGRRMPSEQPSRISTDTRRENNASGEETK